MNPFVCVLYPSLRPMRKEGNLYHAISNSLANRCALDPMGDNADHENVPFAFSLCLFSLPFPYLNVAQLLLSFSYNSITTLRNYSTFPTLPLLEGGNRTWQIP